MKRSQFQLWSKGRDNVSSEEEGGSVAGASLLFAGTAIGAGMLALPAETMAAGFIPTIFGLILCCIFTYVTSIIVLEASWLVSCDETCGVENGDDGGGFLLIARNALGIPGEVITAVLFWFLLTAIIVAYTAEGGQLISTVVEEVLAIPISPTAGSLIFSSFFASLAIYGTSKVDAINRVFVLGLIGSFLALVATGLPMVKASNLFDRSDWTSVYPTVISIGILSFGAQNVVPTLLRYLNNDPDRTRQSILYGTLMPLVLYTIWEVIFIGVIDSSAASSSVNKMDAINVLGQTGGQVVNDFVEIFSICAIGSSMAGASVSLVDFFVDASKMFATKKEIIPSESGSIEPRLFAAAIALGPPLILAYAFPDIFLVALEEAGLLGGVSLYGLLPAISILALRTSNPNAIMPGRLRGGYTALFVIAGLSTALILPEIFNLI
jgi:tyrosine-specific transport protein